jgi:Tol biopolymer transport system component
VPAQAAAPGKIDPSKLKGTIVFASDRAGHLDIWRMKASGGDPKPLTNDTHPDADPRFSPDGKKILYTSLRGGFPEIWLMNRDGSDARKVAAGSQGAWSPDGTSILLIRDNQAFVRDLAGGQERKVVPDAWERCGVPAWHPDGKTFAVASRHEETIGVYLLSLDGKENRRLKTSEAACTPFFSKDGKKILFQTVKGRIHQMKLDGTGEEPVTFGADIQHDGRYSPDGRYLLFARAPAAEGPWQVCVADLDSDDLDYIALTKEGSNSLPDWHPE